MTENPAITSIRSTIRNLRSRTEAGGYLHSALGAARYELKQVEDQIADALAKAKAWEEVLEQLGQDQKTLDKAQTEFRERYGLTPPRPPGTATGGIIEDPFLNN